MAQILVVDDEESIRNLLRTILEKAGHVVETASDGEDAVARLRTALPELLITDILMPRMGGLNVIRELRARDAEVPVIAISGGGIDGKLNFLKTAVTYPGVIALDKPFGNRELLAAVRQALEP